MSFLASFCDGISIVSYIILAAKTVIKMMTENLVNPSCQKTTKYFWLNNSIIIGCIRYIENDIAPIFTRLGNSKETPDFSSSDKEVTRPKQGIAHCISPIHIEGDSIPQTDITATIGANILIALFKSLLLVFVLL